ncbi:hypothetical protein MLD38_020294 [Melastoma candidum]|uniref:Uncharacterized protein n=1 Tax=Melastoma candidum TaxID=119954 RepID=A0ACB9QCN1_9MYRT|nr:hypothetical protein MLD38_020294 [Melastoma candidum]
MGRMMLPLNLTPDEGPSLVPKLRGRTKLHGVTRYMHVSSHLYSMCHPRGSGGRFLNMRNLNNVNGGVGMKKDGVTAITQPTGSPRSRVLQSNSRTSNSQKETDGSPGITSGSEVTSMFSQPHLDHIIHQGRPLPIYSFPGMMEKNAQSIIMQSKWVAAADNCCNLKF